MNPNPVLRVVELSQNVRTLKDVIKFQNSLIGIYERTINYLLNQGEEDEPRNKKGHTEKDILRQGREKRNPGVSRRLPNRRRPH
jgi:hypothetical protein